MADAGWYDDGSGQQRWWDGNQWTEHVQDASATEAVVAAADVMAPSAGSRLGEQAARALRAASGHRQDAAAIDEQPEGTLWSAKAQRLTGLNGGRYRLTREILFFESGTLSLKGQQILTHEISDVDVAQTITQKARGVGDIIVTADRPKGTERIVLSDIADFRGGAQMINTVMRQAKRDHAEFQVLSNTQRVQQEVYYSGSSPVVAGIAPSVALTPERVDLVSEIQKLAEFRSQGILTEEEFAAGKRKLLGL